MRRNPWPNGEFNSKLLLDQLDYEDDQAGTDNTADDVADDTCDHEAAEQPAEYGAADQTDNDIDEPGE